jgi:hypothetical protein
MALDTKHLMSLVELAHRRHEPAGADLQRSLHLARMFEADPSVPVAFRSLAWHVVIESHEVAGWPIPKGERFPACCGGAASARHACALLIQEIAEYVASMDGRVVVLGALAASRALYGSWHVLPTSGAYLVPLEEKTNGDLPPPTVFHGSVGVRWGSAGPLRDVFEEHTSSAELAGREVLIPTPELITARTAGCGESAATLECLIFCTAAHTAAEAGSWPTVRDIAPRLGLKHAPVEAACRLGIERWLGLEVSAPRRAVFAVKRLLARHRAA